jgi:hypothetical protein
MWRNVLMATTAIEKGWRIQLFSPNGWVSVNERPLHKRRAAKAARTWAKDGKIRARIVKVRVVTETLEQEEV